MNADHQQLVDVLKSDRQVFGELRATLLAIRNGLGELAILVEAGATGEATQSLRELRTRVLEGEQMLTTYLYASDDFAVLGEEYALIHARQGYSARLMHRTSPATLRSDQFRR